MLLRISQRRQQSSGDNMKILSIDYDYFQQVSVDTMRKCYPDGIDLPTDVSNIVWASKYADPRIGKLIEKVALNEKELDLAIDILNNQSADIPVMVTNSHIHAFHFILDNVLNEFGHKNLSLLEGDTLELVNVDMHHDILNENERLDCGNWIGQLLKKFDPPFSWQWISNPVSDEMYGLSKKEDPQWCFPIETSLEKIKDEQFDAVFLCRSDNWSPPHLDYGFTMLGKIILNHFNRDKLVANIFLDNERNIDSTIKSMKRAYKNVEDRLK